MADEHDYGDCFAGSRHIETLVNMMQMDGVDVVVSSGDTCNAVPFTTIVVQGRYAAQAQALGEQLQDIVTQERIANRGKLGDN